MLFVISYISFLTGFTFILAIFPLEWEARPTLQTFGYDIQPARKKTNALSFIRSISYINKPFCQGTIRNRLIKELAMAHVNLTPEEFFFFKELCIAFILVFTFPFVPPDLVLFWVLMAVSFGYMIPEYWLKNKVKKVKGVILKELPDAVDLLGLCVNAGLDFMLALKWVVEKSPPSVMINELNTLLQEINVGKTRREALRSLADKYNLPDLATFSRTLIQADKMGTSVAEALNILSEDMREARYRRGEQMAMKAPMKLLVPLLFFIFPVVGILVAGPIFIQFSTDNPLAKLGR
ncbi:MAG: type II secretion system F family protein [Candidatus Omnitrophota bacterium]